MSLRRALTVAIALAAFSAAFLVVASCTAEGEGSPFSNVKILTHVTSKSEMRSIMKEQGKALGVKCTFCHVKGKFGLDDKEMKQEAREMMTMVQEINAKYFAEPGEDGESHAITCWTCHRGSEHPELTRPVESEEDEDVEAAPEGE